MVPHMSKKKRILILTADAGFGHRAAANAVAASFKFQYGDESQVDIVNPLDDKRVPFFLRDSQTDYDRIVRDMPDLYRLGYQTSTAPIPTAIIERALIVLLYEVMEDLIGQFEPDVILVTYPIYQAPIAAVFDINKCYIPLYSAVTDLVDVHPIWFNKNVDGCFVPTENSQEEAIRSGIPPEKVFVTGIPVHPNIHNEQRGSLEIRSKLGWRPDLLTFLAVGSRRVESLTTTLNVINHFGAQLQIIAVAGKDKDLYRSLIMTEWHIPVHIYEYTSTMPMLMKASDAIISKAGGLIVTESLASGLPILLTDVIPGQETGNAEYVVENGAGDRAETPLDVLEVLAHWLAADKALFYERARNARRLGKPKSAFKVAEMLWKAANEGFLDKPSQHKANRPGLLELLAEFRVQFHDHFLHLPKK